VTDADAAQGTTPPSRLRHPRLRPCRDCVAVLLALAVVAEPPALARTNPGDALHTSSEPKHLDRDHPVALFHLAAEDVLPPGRMSAKQSQCMCSSTHTHVRIWTLPLAGPMLTAAHTSSPRANEADSRPSACYGVRASLVEPRCPTLSMSSRSLLPPAIYSRTPAPERVKPCSPCPKRCTHVFTCTYDLASELPRYRAHPSRDAAELEPHRAVFHRAAVLVREIHLTTAHMRLRLSRLSPLLSLHESGEHVLACEPNLTVAQPVMAGTPLSRASFLPRRTSARPNQARVHCRSRERIQPNQRRPPQPCC
jgi:hypothetical protein